MTRTALEAGSVGMKGDSPECTKAPHPERETGGLCERLISDEEIVSVHGSANFGTMTPREVVNDGVRKAALGYHTGHTQFCILRDHGLITKPRGFSYDFSLTKKGKKYARALSIFADPEASSTIRALAEQNAAQAAELERLQRLVESLLGAISWIDKPFVGPTTSFVEMHQRIGFVRADRERALNTEGTSNDG